MNHLSSEYSSPDDAKTGWLEVVRQNVAGLRYGSIQITVHEGRVTQVESTQKTRFATCRDEAASQRK